MDEKTPEAKGTPVLNLTSPRQVSRMLAKYGASAKKSLGQNFLVDANTLHKIVRAADLKASDVVLEVGAGVGVLTSVLAEQAGRVVSVETDRSLAPVLAEVLAGKNNVDIIFNDILKVRVEEVFLPNGFTPKVVANLPYYITTPVLFHLLEAKINWEVLVFLVQKEVAERVVSAPGSKTYGALSVMVQHQAEAEILGVIPPTVFLPRPKVYSAILRLKPKEKSYPEEVERAFRVLVKAAFSQRRKNLYNALRGVFPELGGEERVKRAFQVFNVEENRRGETISPELFFALASFLVEA
ncbi:MAG TPA: 16S rRNA (adenine(1518)-N(6)/adenine(1519)-N(6))-dimethyltransferase RsmA [Bacillota bacterium]